MTAVGDFQLGVAEALTYGQQVSITVYNTSTGAGSYYDDDISLTQSGGDFWTSGVILPISQTRGSEDAVLIEQGNVLTNDSKLYIAGSIPTSGVIKLGLGSPNTSKYSIIAEGITNWSVNEVDILKKLYIRQLTNGSFIGE